MMSNCARPERGRNSLFFGWAISSGAGSSVAKDARETLKWRDHSSDLTVSEIGTESNAHHRVRLGDTISVDILSGRRLVTAMAPSVPQYTLDHFLADQVIPRALAHEGSFIVHAGAVQVDEAAILVMGSSGGGKSTLSTSFDQSGLAMLGDDAMVVSRVNDRFCAKAVYPSLRLLPDSIQALLPNSIGSTAVAHYSAKRRVSMPLAETADPLPIGAIFVLAAPAGHGGIDLRRLTEKQACMAFIANSFALDPSDTARAGERLVASSALARQVPTFEIGYPRDYARLPEVRETILGALGAL